MELQHSKMMGFMLDTLGIPHENTFQGNYRQRLEKLMKVNNLSSFIYSNVCPKRTDGGMQVNLPVRVVGHLSDGALLIGQAAGDDPQRLTGIGFLNKATHYLSIQNTEDNWAIYDKHIDKAYEQNCETWKAFDAETLPNAIYKQIYDEFVEAGFSLNPPKDKEDPNKLFTEISNSVQKQINKEFYQDVKLRVDIHQLDENGKEKNLFVAINNEDVYTYEIKLDVVLNAKGQVQIDHATKEDYLQEFVDGWQKEASERGYTQEEINVEVLRQQVRTDFASEETKQNFYAKFIQGLLTDAVASYVEGVQATQKVGKHIWETGVINESTWHSSEEFAQEHRQWPDYMQLDPVLGGAADGVVDEIVGIPMAIRTVYGIATDEKQRDALLGMFSAEGFTKMKDGLKQEVDEISTDEEKAKHFAAMTTVVVISTLVGFGLITKGGKIGDVIDTTLGKLGKVVDPKVMNVMRDVRDHFKKRPKDRKLIDNYKTEVGEDAYLEMMEDVTSDTEKLVSLKRNPANFINGKKFEKNVEGLIESGDENFLGRIAVEADLDPTELLELTRIHQVQINLPDGGYTVADNVWVKTVDDGIGGFNYNLIINESKLSTTTKFTKRQKEFIEAIGRPDSKFTLRNTKFTEDGFVQGIPLNVQTYIRTAGNGVADNLEGVLIEKIK